MIVRRRLSGIVNLKVAFAGMAVAALLSGTSAVGTYRAQRDTARQSQQLAEVVAALKTEIRIREAQQCVNSWAAREDVRDGIEKGSEAILKVATDTPPDRVAAYRAAVQDARREIPNPTCDLVAAKRRLR